MKPEIRARIIVGWFLAATLTATACSSGSALPTSPTAAGALDQGAVIATALSPASSPLASLYVTKTCDVAFPSTPICTVITSQAGPLPVGTQAYYTFAVIDPATAHRLSAQLDLTTPGDGGTASGHCTLSFKTGLGRCVFTGGTGDLAGFHANLDVTFAFASGITTWEGTYHFVGR